MSDIAQHMYKHPYTHAIDLGGLLADFLLDMVPHPVSDVKAGMEAVTGRRPLTGERLSKGERVLSGIGVLPFVPPLAGVAKGIRRTRKVPRSFLDKELVHTIKSIGLHPNQFIGNIKAERVARLRFGEKLSQESNAYLRWVEKSRNKSAIHPNNKTAISMDFSTSCPSRASGLGPCPYCYVEEARTAKEMGIGFMHGKMVTETPYRREILAMPDDLVSELNRDGGLRMFSFGDYRTGVDDVSVGKVLEDASQKGLMIKAITKQKGFVERFGDHPNLRINISVDNLPREMSNSPTVEEATEWAAGRENIKIRVVALNETEAEKFGKDPRVDVITLYHGYTGDNLFKIIKAQNPALVKRVGAKKLRAMTNKWQNMPPRSQAFKRIAKKYGHKLCCQGGKCSIDPTKCGFGVSATLILGVHLPEMFEDNESLRFIHP